MNRIQPRVNRCEQLEDRSMLAALNPTMDSFYRWTMPPRSPSDEIRIEDTSSQLVRYHDRVEVSMETRELNPENIYTAWWAVFNAPEACHELFGLPCLDIEAARAFVYYAGEVKVEAEGFGSVAHFEASLGRNQVCKDSQAAVCEPLVAEPYADLAGADMGLIDPFTATVHVVIRDHGPALSHPDLLHFQKTRMEGGCLLEEFELFEEFFEQQGLPLSPNICRNVQFTVHEPADIDFDDNGLVTGDDIDLLFAVLGSTNERFNLDDEYGKVSESDMDVLVQEILLIEYGDTNLDHAIDFADFLVLSDNFGGTDAGWAEGDFNGDHQVGFDDFLLLSSNFGIDRDG